LEQLAAPLRNAGRIQSSRGAYGGDKLTTQPRHMKAGDVIRALEGPIKLVEGIENEEPAQQALWLRITQDVKNVLDTTTLDDLTHSDVDDQQEEYMFYI